jgi:hypothetical protein
MFVCLYVLCGNHSVDFNKRDLGRTILCRKLWGRFSSMLVQCNVSTSQNCP